jgi:F0F1-type ATP synthase alpha subunit
MTGVAARFAAEEVISALRSGLTEIPAWLRLGRGQRELIELQRRQLARDLIVIW